MLLTRYRRGSLGTDEDANAYDCRSRGLPQLGRGNRRVRHTIVTTPATIGDASPLVEERLFERFRGHYLRRVADSAPLIRSAKPASARTLFPPHVWPSRRSTPRRSRGPCY